MAETTIQKTGGAKTLPEIIRNAGLGQRKIQALEAYLRNAAVFRKCCENSRTAEGV